MKAKRFFGTMAVFAFVLVLGLAGCSSGGSSQGGSQTVVSAKPTVETQTVYVMTEKSLLNGTYKYSDFEFDNHGNLVSEIEKDTSNKGYENTITYEYTDDGVLKKKTEHIVGQYYKYPDYQLTTLYDEHGNIESIESTSEEGKGKVGEYGPGEYKNTYNEKGQLVEMAYGEGGKNIVKYTYDADGNIASFWSSGAHEEGYTTTCTYDEHGNRIREDVKDEHDGDTWSNIFTYEAKSVEVEVQ